jgi:hypothetical protein
MPYQRHPEQRRIAERPSTRYLDYIRQQPCCIPGCDDNVSVEAHHVRIGSFEYGSNPGAGQKADDRWALPLCWRHHQEAHTGEREFWASLHIDPFRLCLKYQVKVK